MANLGFFGSADLPQSSQGASGFRNSLLFGHLYMTLDDRSLPIGNFRGSFAANPSQCDRVFSPQFLRTQVVSLGLLIQLEAFPGSSAHTE